MDSHNPRFDDIGPAWLRTRRESARTETPWLVPRTPRLQRSGKRRTALTADKRSCPSLASRYGRLKVKGVAFVTVRHARTKTKSFNFFLAKAPPPALTQTSRMHATEQFAVRRARDSAAPTIPVPRYPPV